MQSHGPRTMIRSLRPTLHYKIKGRQTYYPFTSYALCTHKIQNLYIKVTICDQSLGSKLQNFPWGIPHPIVAQHKHRDSPSSHSIGAKIFERRPPNSTWTVARLEAHWVVAYCASWTHYSKTIKAKLLSWICSCSPHLHELGFNWSGNEKSPINPPLYVHL